MCSRTAGSLSVRPSRSAESPFSVRAASPFGPARMREKAAASRMLAIFVGCVFPAPSVVLSRSRSRSASRVASSVSASAASESAASRCESPRFDLSVASRVSRSDGSTAPGTSGPGASSATTGGAGFLPQPQANARTEASKRMRRMGVSFRGAIASRKRHQTLNTSLTLSRRRRLPRATASVSVITPGRTYSSASTPARMRRYIAYFGSTNSSLYASL